MTRLTQVSHGPAHGSATHCVTEWLKAPFEDLHGGPSLVGWTGDQGGVVHSFSLGAGTASVGVIWWFADGVKLI